MSCSLKRNFFNVDNNEKQCSICYDKLGDTDYCVTKCGHIFCNSCLFKSIDIKKECPCCRAVLYDMNDNKCRKINLNDIDTFCERNIIDLLRQDLLRIIKNKFDNFLLFIIESYLNCNCNHENCINKRFTTSEINKTKDLIKVLICDKIYHQLINHLLIRIFKDVSINQIIITKENLESMI